MTRILAFGDSFVLGDQDDFGPQDFNYNPNIPITHNMEYGERVTFLKNNVSFASLIAKNFNYDYLNFAMRGLGNFVQLDLLIKFIKDGNLKPDDIILFGLTSNGRDRLSLLMNHHKSKKTDSLPSIISHEITHDWELVEQYDCFYVLSILNNISNKYKIPIIKFNLFSNTLYNVTGILDYSSDNYIGLGLPNNTLIDILNDTWGQPNDKKHAYHTELTIAEGYEHLYTWNKHPSIEGHKKIADWMLNDINWNGLKHG